MIQIHIENVMIHVVLVTLEEIFYITIVLNVPKIQMEIIYIILFIAKKDNVFQLTKKQMMNI